MVEILLLHLFVTFLKQFKYRILPNAFRRTAVVVKILVVEDDTKLNSFVCNMLNTNGYTAKGALSANEAYNLMYNDLYDIIISDIMMPGIDGFEFAQQYAILTRKSRFYL